MSYKRIFFAIVLSSIFITGINLGSVNASIPGVNEQIDVTTAGVIGNLNSGGASTSRDGRYVAFSSRASNLVANDTNSTWDVFVRDRTANTVIRVSVASNGTQGNGYAQGNPSISDDGRYVVFNASSSNLVTGDTNSAIDVFMYDLQTSTTQVVSNSSSSIIGNSNSQNPVISGDAKFVAFESYASNLVSPTTSGSNVFVKNLVNGNTQMISKSASGTYGNGSSWGPSISCDGGVVSFHSNATNLVSSSDTNGFTDVIVVARAGGDTLTNITLGGNNGSAESRVSCDGMHVAYTSNATNLVATDTNSKQDVFKYDRRSNAATLVSVGSTGSQGNDNSLNPSINADGRLVAFSSTSTNLVSGDTNAVNDVFMRDTLSSSTYRVSVDSSGVEGNASSTISSNGASVFSNDGKYLLLNSTATNLVSGGSSNGGGVFISQTGL